MIVLNRADGTLWKAIGIAHWITTNEPLMILQSLTTHHQYVRFYDEFLEKFTEWSGDVR